MGKLLQAIVGSIITLAVASDSSAGAPQALNQAPGYYRLMVGDFEVTALSDGTARLALDTHFPNLPPAAVVPELDRWRQAVPYEMSINAFLINTGSKLILIDAGLGAFLEGRAGGLLLRNLVASGYRADQIDAVLITHLHVDHVSGLSSGAKAIFPNAVVYLSEPERDFWFGATDELKAGPELYPFIEPSRAALGPYLKAHRVKTFKTSTSLWPGVRADLTPGHSAGHTVYSISSRNQTMTFLGDLVHSREIQFDKPGVSFIYDSDRAGAVQQRKEMFAQLSESRNWVATSHLSFPGIGHIRAAGTAFDWIPATYSLKSLK